MASDDVRARRAERVREQKIRDMPKVVAKNAVIGVAVLVAVGGLGAAIWWSTQGQPDDVHWHAAWEVWYYDDQPPSGGPYDIVGNYVNPQYTNRGYDFSGPENPLKTPGSYHIHPNGTPGSDNVMHLEFRAPPFLLWKFFNGLRVDMDRASVQFDDLHGGERIRNNDTHEWRLFVQPSGGDWRLERDFRTYEAEDGDRLLVTYGDADEMDAAGGELERQLASVNWNGVQPYASEERRPDRVGGGEPPAGGDGNATTDARRD